jgi:xylulose-5-phosphate/fructose-6-phosphate phosphoketolase
MADSQPEHTVYGLTDQPQKWSAFTETRSTINEKPLAQDELVKMNKYFNATLYLCLGMLYLKENPLLQEPLKKEHIKPRLLGHWGSDAGQSFTYVVVMMSLD